MSPRTVITWAENCEIFRDPRPGLPPVLPEQVRRGRAAHRRRVLPALLRSELDLDSPRHRSQRALSDEPAWREPRRASASSASRSCARRRSARSAASATCTFAAAGCTAARQQLPAFAPHLHPASSATTSIRFRGAADGLALAAGAFRRRPARAAGPRHPVRAPGLRAAGADPRRGAGAAAIGRRARATCSTASTPGRWPSTLGPDRDTTRHPALHRGADGPRAGARQRRARRHRRPDRATRGKLVRRIGPDLAGLRRTREDQAAYAVHAAAIAEHIAELLQREAEDEVPTDAAADEQRPRRASRCGWTSTAATKPARREPPPSAAPRSTAAQTATASSPPPTTSEHRSDDLVRSELLREYRVRLDQLIAAAAPEHCAPGARSSRPCWRRPMSDGWESAQEQGRIDGARLAQLISSPAERRLFRDERIEPRGRIAS